MKESKKIYQPARQKKKKNQPDPRYVVGKSNTLKDKQHKTKQNKTKQKKNRTKTSPTCET